ncbi:MAG TPA: NUDIX domain-containing protein [Streptosporangiaceae bacterium]|nr:NUDIX domain-containing protein [Streptosporangiaceae bacterium]
MADGPRDVAALIAAIEPYDDTERAQQADVLAWLASTSDIYRRVKPATPPRHLVSYTVLTDPRHRSVFLVDHRLSGLWLPAGGHVEPGEDPAVTAEREAHEELGIEADFSMAGRRPVFVTATPATGPAPHTDVSLWYLLAGFPGMPIVLDPREFAGGRWWTGPDLDSADPARFDPNMGRFLAKVGGAGFREAGLRGQPRA